MITVFLPPFPFRGDRAPYLWFFYKLISRNPNEKMNFIFSQDYLNAHEILDVPLRWELDSETAAFLGYSCPDSESLAKHTYHFLAEQIYDDLLRTSNGNPLLAFRKFLSTRSEALEAALDSIFSNESVRNSEIVLAPVNCPSLTAIAEKYSIPVAHIELGPLRAPQYIRTAYFDFSGVNGNSEAERRFIDVSSDFGVLHSALQDLREFFLWDHNTPSFEVSDNVGVPLQVEDDSNIIGYGHGYDNISLINYAAQTEKNLLVRQHPKSSFMLRVSKSNIDDSNASIEFLLKCRKIITINSSVGFEAILFGVSTEILGDSSFSFLMPGESEFDKLSGTAHYLFAYLVPYDAVFDAEYIRYRLQFPSEQNIIRQHLALYGYTSTTPELASIAQVIDNGIELSKMDRIKSLAHSSTDDLVQLHALSEGAVKSFSVSVDEYQRVVTELENIKIASAQDSLIHDEKLTKLRNELEFAEQQVDNITNSRSWKVTSPLRAVSSELRVSIRQCARILNKLRYVISVIRRNPKVINNAFLYLKSNGISKTFERSLQSVSNSQSIAPLEIKISKVGYTKILTVPHCTYIAKLIQHQLERAGFKSKIIYESSGGEFDGSLHFVVCPQIFKKLPGLYVAIQMEQSISDRWFDERYMRILENSYAIFDYSIKNVAYLQEKGLSLRQINFMPVDCLLSNLGNTTESKSKEYDVIFYGDINNDRRREYLAKIGIKFNLKIINNIFGHELLHELSKAKVVVNIHYYEDALLETCRIYECLSHDALIVSESSSDIDAHDRLRQMVDFVDVGNIDEMIERISYWVSNDAARIQQIDATRHLVQNSPNEFEYYFQRFLLSTDNIDFDTFYKLAANNIKFDTNYVCLGLPESVARRKDFEADNTFGFQYFPGLKHSIGWVGCGLSYKFIMRKAQEQGFSEITVCEDDVEFLPGWKQKFDQIHTHLYEETVSWDIFSGLIANLHIETQIKKIDDFQDFELVHIDKMVSTVLNTYNSRVFSRFNEWDSNYRDPYINTIDKFIEGKSNIDIVTTTPFLVGHKEEMMSTLWGFKNTQYRDYISASVKLLNNKVAEHKAIVKKQL